MRRAFVFALLLAACGEPPARTPPPPAPAPLETAPPPAPPPAPAPSPPPVPLSLEATARAVHEQLVAVDTSHGHETAALEPIAERFRQVGVPVEIVESAPGRGNLVARVRGSGAKRPLLLLAHVDVVPVEGQPWTTSPFKPTEKDGFLWGRGVSDDKAMAAAIVAIVLELSRDKTPLSRDVIVALTAGEETGGSAGVKWLLDHRRELLDAEIALNEGGMTRTSADFASIVTVGIGAAEKTYRDFRLVVRGRGGHSSVPPSDSDPIASLSRALVRVHELKFPAHVLPAVKEQLATAAATSMPPLADALRRAAAGAPKIAPADEKIIATDRVFNALVRTTCVATMLSGAPQENVLPTSAEANVNCRILPDQTPEQVLEALKKAIADPAVEVTTKEDLGFGPYSPVDGVVPAAMKKVAAALWPGVPCVPTMGTGTTDSRHLRAAGIAAYGIGVAPTSLEEIRAGHGAHGPDERVPVRWLAPGVRWLREVTLELAR
jgi:acetylornithine deacetylase/succinyl-diaminopimelate desuccinylase-like protein